MSKKTRKKTQKKTLKKPSKVVSRAAPRSASKKAAAKKQPAKAAKSAGKGGKQPVAKTPNRASPQAPKAQRPKAAAAATTAIKTAIKTTPKPATAKTRPAPPPSRAEAPATGHTGFTEGAKAPAFRLPRDGGATISLSDFAGQKLVLFFYPRADTPGCTREAIDFTRLAKTFAESRTAVVGVSADAPRAQEAFRNKHELAIPLASDEQHEMLEAYGVWGEKSMYGRTFLGISRTTVLIGPDSRVIRIWRNVKVDGHAEEVLAAVQNA
ncbi:MAG TPA: peroxiredoxin [Bradyrhizobium sp.]